MLPPAHMLLPAHMLPLATSFSRRDASAWLAALRAALAVSSIRSCGIQLASAAELR